MRLCKLGICLLSLSVIFSFKASALGLGEIRVNSTLNQPLDAEITLLQVRDLTEDEILVGLASSEDFRNLGIDRGFFLSSLRFDVRIDDPDGPVVKITSTELVREPFLNFLVESQWPSGRVLREYTLLLDLPVYSAQSPDRVEAPQTAPAAQPVVREPAQPAAVQNQPSTPARPVTRTQPSSPRITGQTFGPVQSNDTLWEIAQTVRPSDRYSIQQTMIAIQRLNPEAFINNNINLLRRGQVLRVPTEDDLAQLNETQAINEVAFQNTQWTEETSGAGLSASGVTPSTRTQAPSNQGRVSLGVGEGSSNSPENTSARGNASQQASALQNELAITLEELDTAKRENTELKSRISDLEQQIQTMERLIEVSSDELRALQLASQQNGEVGQELQPVDAATEQPAQQQTNVEGAGEESQSAVEAEATPASESPVAQAPVTQPEASEPATVTPTPAPARNPVVVNQPAPQKGIVDIIFDNITYVAGGLLALLLIVLLVVRRIAAKRKEEEEELVDPFEQSDLEDDVEPLPSDDDMDLDAPIEDQTVRLDHDDAASDTDQAQHEQEDLAEEALANIVPEEVIAEADIYIAYGKYDQAEEMLKRALQADPDNADAQVKLLEVYAESGNLEKFDERFQLVHETGDNSAIVRGNQLRSQFSDAAPFVAAGIAAGAAAGVGASMDQFDEVDFSALGESEESSNNDDLLSELNAFDSTESSEIELPSDDSTDSIDDLDFDSFALDDDLDSENLDGESSEQSILDSDTSTDSEEEFSLDLGDDLNFDSLASELDEQDAQSSSSDDLVVEDSESDDDFSFDLDLDFDEPTEDSSVSLEDDTFDTDLSETSDDLGSLSDDLGSLADAGASDDEISLDLDGFDAPLGEEADSNDSALSDDFDFADLDDITADSDSNTESVIDLDDGLLDTDGLSESSLDDIDLSPELEDELSADTDLELDGGSIEDNGLDGEGLESLDLSSEIETDLDADLSLDLEEDSELTDLNLDDELSSLDSELNDLDSELPEIGEEPSSEEPELSSDSIEDELESDNFVDNELDDIDLSSDSSLDFDESLLALDEALDAAETESVDSEEADLSLDAELDLDLGDELESPEQLAESESVVDLDADLSAGDDLPEFDATEEQTPESMDLDDLSLDEADLSSNELNDSMFDDIDSDLDFDEQSLESNNSVDLDSGDEETVASLDDLESVTSEETSGALDGLESELSLDDSDLDLPVLNAEHDVASEMESVDDDLDLEELDEGLDLEALDKEMDALVGHTDNIGDTPTLDEVAGLEIDAEDEEVESEDFFNQAVSTSEIETDDSQDNVVELDNDMSFLANTDESDTKLDLAKAYLDMGDSDGARDILDEVMSEGNDKQREEAEALLSKMPT
ncbi:FimV/HubP family polar landmark protein [Sessilibacter corallicola]|uniref:FimV/HubP family polar landmark protein n=1 Tax=Sessilibacter corallicola TaxID=2904075 RepID=UPI001E3FF01E|nr:FimV/HubP family polar landmark protein [Sessilibacter corallicola]MCE2026913.1 tetratricopeptide repeat protein [Sessilibacter corallicola]